MINIILNIIMFNIIAYITISLFTNITCYYDMCKCNKYRLALPLPCYNYIRYYMSKQCGNMGKKD